MQMAYRRNVLNVKAYLRRSYACFVYLLDNDLLWCYRQVLERLTEPFLAPARVHQGAQKHITADAARTIEIAYSHGMFVAWRLIMLAR